MAAALDPFSDATRAWFTGTLGEPTPAQSAAWAAISSGEHTLVVAPTGSGKTLAAFLWTIDRLAAGAARHPVSPGDTGDSGEAPATRVVYISPLKALAADVRRNLRAPLTGIAAAARGAGSDPVEVTVGMRTGDSSPSERRRLVRSPPQILITTPESLYLILTSSARDTLTAVDTVIVDEVHAVAGTKRGAHLTVSLERLDAGLARPCRRIGLSATVRPPETAARFLGGAAPVTVVAPAADKRWDLSVEVPVEDLDAPPEAAPGCPAGSGPRDSPEDHRGGVGIWPHIDRRIVELAAARRSTLVFVNSRGLAERLTSRLNAVADDPGFCRAHHGSVSKDRRATIEQDLKNGTLRCVVATASLELGIDMGEVDLVVQVSAPPSVSSTVQRIGRSGHGVGAVSTGVLLPKHRTDLLHCTVAARQARAGAIERLTEVDNPLDVLAQQTVAAAASVDALVLEDWFTLVRRAAPFASLPREAFDAVIDMLSGGYSSEDFALLRPQLVFDRTSGTVTARPGAPRLAVTSGGTIADRGVFAVYSAGTGPTGEMDRGDAAGREAGRIPMGGAVSRIGELDEEMVYETRLGDVITLGASTWRVTGITHDRVLVAPAPGRAGRMPFWHGEGPGRPAEFGAAIGAFVRVAAVRNHAACPTGDSSDLPTRIAEAPGTPGSALDVRAADNLARLFAEQRAACGAVPTDTTLVVETFRDELGDWRVILHSPYGRRVHAPWALAVGACLSESRGIDARPTAFDDGIVLRLPSTAQEVPGPELFAIDPGRIDEIVTDNLAGTALFASRFRECAARALLLPRPRPGTRAPLWQQRHRAAQLLDGVRHHSGFPILHETVRECLRDVYDMPALRELLARLDDGRARLHHARTDSPSPFAAALMFEYLGTFIYDADVPLAERRAATLALDQDMLARLIGANRGRALLDPRAIEEVETRLQWLAPGYRARDVESLADMLRSIGPLTAAEIAARSESAEDDRGGGSSADGGRDSTDSDAWLRELAEARRVFAYSTDRDRWAVAEDAARLRDAAGSAAIGFADGIDGAARASDDPLGDLARRFARSHGPFTTAALAGHIGIGAAAATEVLERLAREQRVMSGAFLPSGTESETRPTHQWCDPDVLDRLRRRSAMLARADIAPVAPATLGTFLPRRQRIAAAGGPTAPAPDPLDALHEAIDDLAGAALPAGLLESTVLPARVAGYQPAMLDELTSSGEVLWSAHGKVGGRDGWVFLHTADSAPLTLRAPAHPPDTAVHRALLTALGYVDPESGAPENCEPEAHAPAGAYFLNGLVDRARLDPPVPTADVVRALWDLVWGGWVTGDTLAPLRNLLSGTARVSGTPPLPSRRRGAGTGRGRHGRPAIARARPRAAAVPPAARGRWSLTPQRDPSPTARMHDAARRLLARHGIVAPSVATAQQLPGGFSALYPVLTRMEEAGQCRRGDFIAGMGGPQFAAPDAADRLRRDGADPPSGPVLLAAADPANPYGAAIPWPSPTATHPGRPSRSAGALVVLTGGEPTLFLARGGRSLLTFTDESDVLVPALHTLAEHISRAAAGPGSGGAAAPHRGAHIGRIDGKTVHGNPRARILDRAGYRLGPSGYLPPR